MKRYIYAMAISKHDARLKIESYQDIIKRHLIECVVYSNWEGTKNHWISELSSWLAKISRIKCKSSLTERDYTECLFSSYGDELDDAKWDLDDYLNSSVRKARYPEFEITDELAEEYFEISNKFISSVINHLTSKNTTLEEDWKEILNSEIFV